MTSDRNYVAAWMDYSEQKVVVIERDSEGKTFRKKYNPPYYFYVVDEDGKYESIYGDKLTRVEVATRDEYEFAKKQFDKKFESDFSPLKRVLMDEYYNKKTPPVNFALLDIESDTRKDKGWARPTNPYAIINAVTIYLSWTGKYLTYAVPPKVDGVPWNEIPGNNVEMIYDELDKLISQKLLRANIIPEIVLCKDEAELLVKLLLAIQDADIISGWNSTFYDIPYIAERLLLEGGESLLARLEHAGVRPPRKEMVDRFGKPEPIYKFSGRSHLDYMELFKKFTFEGRSSFALGNILQEEVGVGKLEYEGSLEELYMLNFPTFVLYNFRDVDGIVQLDNKFRFIALANQMAHENTVLFDSVLGTVAYVETGIANHAHYVMHKIVNDKKIGSNEKVEGAIVLTPTPGLYSWLGSVDINSLYPNVIRSLNISPEKIIGQFVDKEKAWSNIWDMTSVRLCFVLESSEQIIKTAEEWGEWLIEKKYAVSAYGTVFDQSNGNGVVADILGYWYSERKRLQAEKKKWGKKVEELKNTLGFDAPAELFDDEEEDNEIEEIEPEIDINISV